MTTDATARRQAILDGETSVRDTVEESLAAIDERDGSLGAFQSVDAEGARRRADALDAALRAGEPPGALFGLPLAFKANLCVEGFEANCGSRILLGYRPPYTATSARRALAAGAVPVGVVHMDEFAMGSSGENSALGIARNPWDPRRSPGGSSSGSAAAVAAGMVPLAFGSDTGGSVRQPAAFCGVSGFKPTYGAVSRHGLVAFGSSLDQVSPLARSARDLERVLRVIAGPDPSDATTLATSPFAPADRGTDDEPRALDGLTVGLAPELFPPELDPAVRTLVERAVDELREHGARVREVSLPHLGHALPTYYVVAMAEASSNLARFDGVRYGLRARGDGTLAGMMAATRAGGFGDEVKRRILLGTYALSSGYYDAWYGRACRARDLLAREFARAFETVDLIAGPTSPTAAFLLGERRDDPLAMYAADVMTVPASLAGLPAASLPCGFLEQDGTRLPAGLQLIGPHGRDAAVLRAARAYQAWTDHHLESPPCVAASPRTP